MYDSTRKRCSPDSYYLSSSRTQYRPTNSRRTHNTDPGCACPLINCECISSEVEKPEATAAPNCVDLFRCWPICKSAAKQRKTLHYIELEITKIRRSLRS